MSSTATERLVNERNKWRKDHPHGFSARPVANPDGSTNLLKWKCIIPGKAKTHWENGRYTLTLTFTEEYPFTPPRAEFPQIQNEPFYHPNVDKTGQVYISILNKNESQDGWKPFHWVKDILLAIQELLNCPNINEIANQEAAELYKKDKQAYKLAIRKQALKCYYY